MARRRKDYSGELRSKFVGFQVTPSERETLEQGAERKQTTLSEHARELCLRRAAAAAIVAGTRRDPEARALMNELTAIGNNLNQLARLANTAKAMPHIDELERTTTLLKAAFVRLLAL